MTLVESLVVIAIIGVLVALLLPAVQAARESARRASCLNNLKQLSLAAIQYHEVNSKFPIGGHVTIYEGSKPTTGTNLWVELLPYIEQDNLHKRWDYDDNRNNVAGGINATQAQVIEILLCPSDFLPVRVVHVTSENTIYAPWAQGVYGLSSYGGNAGKRSLGPPPQFSGMSRDGIFFLESCVRFKDVSDGGTHTLLFGERFHYDPQHDRNKALVHPGITDIAGGGQWGFVAGDAGIMANVTLHSAVPINYKVPPNPDGEAVIIRHSAFGSGHAGGANFAFADGRARFISEDLPLERLQALSTRDGDEIVEEP
jgi:prepilin-type processing-associated H-X9-DG protein